MINLTEKEITYHLLEKDLELVRKNGHNPIAVATLLCESTFCFKTEHQAEIAHKELEKDKNPSIVQGWWYGKKRFISSIKEYEKQYEREVNVFWLNENKL